MFTLVGHEIVDARDAVLVGSCTTLVVFPIFSTWIRNSVFGRFTDWTIFFVRSFAKIKVELRYTSRAPIIVQTWTDKVVSSTTPCGQFPQSSRPSASIYPRISPPFLFLNIITSRLQSKKQHLTGQIGLGGSVMQPASGINAPLSWRAMVYCCLEPRHISWRLLLHLSLLYLLFCLLLRRISFTALCHTQWGASFFTLPYVLLS